MIDELHDGGHLKGLEEPLLQIARIYRNFSAILRGSRGQ